MILNPVKVISSDVNDCLNIRDVKLIEGNNVTRVTVHLINATNKQELYLHSKLMQLAGLYVISIEKTTRKEYWLTGMSVWDRGDSTKRHKIRG